MGVCFSSSSVQTEKQITQQAVHNQSLQTLRWKQSSFVRNSNYSIASSVEYGLIVTPAQDNNLIVGEDVTLVNSPLGPITTDMFDAKTATLQYRPGQVQRSHSPTPNDNLAATYTESQKYRYKTCVTRNLIINGSWLGNIMGDLDVTSFSFSRNPQILIQGTVLNEIQRFTFKLVQETNAAQKATITVLKRATSGKKPLSNFGLHEVVAQAKPSKSNVVMDVLLLNLPHPYTIICTHSSLRDGNWSLVVDSDKDFIIQVPSNCVQWVDPISSLSFTHRKQVDGRWTKGCGFPTESDYWTNSPQQLVHIKEPTLLYVELTNSVPLRSALFVTKLRQSQNEKGEPKRYKDDRLPIHDLVAQVQPAVSTKVVLRTVLIPRRLPYVIIACGDKVDAKFKLVVQANNPIA